MLFNRRPISGRWESLRNFTLLLAAAWITTWLYSVPRAQGEQAGTYNNFFIYFENDAFAGTDKYYTNAFRLTWLSPDLTEYDEDRRLPRWGVPLIRKLPLINRPGFQRNVGLSIGQNIYTPENLRRRDLIRDDRPYAGWSYFSLTFHIKNAVQMDTFEISGGIVGPSSLAEETQRTVHKWINNNDPKGWHNQLKDEPGLIVSWQRNWRLVSVGLGDGFGFDFIPRIGAAVGNVATFADVGGELRFGYNIPLDFGTSPIRPGSGIDAPVDTSDPRIRRSKNFGFHLFGYVEGRAVAQNIFLDGNSWKESHSVDKRPLVADIAAGFAVLYKRVKLSFTFVHRTKEFDRQDQDQQFGSVTAGITF